MTTSGPFADTHDLIFDEPKLTNNQHLVMWTENPHLAGAQAGSRNLLAGRLTLNFFKQQARGEVLVAVAQAMEMSRVEMRDVMGALENRISSQAKRWKTREEVCSEKQVQNFKDIKCRVMNFFKNTSKTFNTMCQKFKASKLRVEKKWNM